jgi:hypothetical protein
MSNLKILKEITVWDKVDYIVRNHTYAINDAGKMVAYKKSGDTQWFVFPKPRFFDRARRKFITLKTENSKVAADFFEQMENV